MHAFETAVERRFHQFVRSAGIVGTARLFLRRAMRPVRRAHAATHDLRLGDDGELLRDEQAVRRMMRA